MGKITRYTDYDGFARVYNEHWGPGSAKLFLPVLELLLLDRIPKKARILDLCCGSGHLTQALVEKGYALTGLDGSSALLKYARGNSPNTRFVHEDARTFQMENQFHAVVCMYDSLNHVIRLEQLKMVFKNVANALKARGWFVFDMNLPHKYESSWKGSFAIIGDDLVCAIQSKAEMDTRVADFKACVFEKKNEPWTRKDVTLYQTWYSVETIKKALRGAGLSFISVFNKSGAEIEENADRAFFTCKKDRRQK